MSRPASEKNETWYAPLAELMAQTGMGIKEAAGRLGLDLSSETLELVIHRKGFNRLLWEHRHRYFNSLANNPDFKKDTVIGKLISLAQKLEDEGAYDKAAEALLKCSKVAGFVGPESTVSVFGELSQADLDAIRKKVEEGQKGATGRIN